MELRAVLTLHKWCRTQVQEDIVLLQNNFGNRSLLSFFLLFFFFFLNREGKQGNGKVGIMKVNRQYELGSSIPFHSENYLMTAIVVSLSPWSFACLVVGMKVTLTSWYN